MRSQCGKQQPEAGFSLPEIGGTMKALLCAAAAAAALACASSAFAQNSPIKLKISYQFPEHHFVTVGCINPFIKGVEDRLPGRVVFERYPAEQLAKAFNQLDSVRNRVADIGIHNLAYTPQNTPLSTFLELPGIFGFDDTLAAQRAWDRLAKSDLAKAEFAKLKVVPAWVFVTSPYQFQMTGSEPIATLDQLKGKKLRVPGAGAEMALNLIGAVGVRVPASDLYLAIQRGTVDGSIISTSALPAYKLDEVVNSISTNASWGASPFIAAMNETRWSGLPEDVRTAITDAGVAAGEACAKTYIDLETKENDRLRGKGKTLFQVPDTFTNALHDALKPLRDDWLSQMKQRGLDGQMILDKYAQYLKEEKARQ
jgi:TRAP-type C4-dicarboxylate transport system substrate-binding protein